MSPKKGKGIVSKLTEGTLIPLSLAVACFGGGGAWMTMTTKDVQTVTREVATIQQERKENREKILKALEDLKMEVSEIHGMLKRRDR